MAVWIVKAIDSEDKIKNLKAFMDQKQAFDFISKCFCTQKVTNPDISRTFYVYDCIIYWGMCVDYIEVEEKPL